MKFKPGDKVLCIHNTGTNLTIGNIYVVKRIDNTKQLYVIEDDGNEGGRFESRFIPYTEYMEHCDEYKNKIGNILND